MSPSAFADDSCIRAFVAVSVPDTAASALECYLQRLRPLARVRWVKKSQLHMTLRFLGEQTKETIAHVKEALAPLTVEPFTIELSYAGAFPNMQRPHILWLSGERGKTELTALAATVNSALEAVGFPRETRKFTPHLTLARTEGTPLPPPLRQALETPPVLTWQYHSFDLMRSSLTPQGEKYSKISLS